MSAATFAIKSLPKIDAQSDKKSILNFITKAKTKSRKILQSKDFNELFQAQLLGKWADQATSINTYPMVAAAKNKADEQQLLYDEDMFYDTDAGEFPVPPGDYHAPPTFVNGVKVINSYFELFAKFMLMDFTTNWMVQHTQQ